MVGGVAIQRHLSKNGGSTRRLWQRELGGAESQCGLLSPSGGLLFSHPSTGPSINGPTMCRALSLVNSSVPFYVTKTSDQTIRGKCTARWCFPRTHRRCWGSRRRPGPAVRTTGHPIAKSKEKLVVRIFPGVHFGCPGGKKMTIRIFSGLRSFISLSMK